MHDTTTAPMAQPPPVAEDAARSSLTDLLQSSRPYHTTEDYQALLAFVSRLRNFAPFNAMLLHIQKPGLTYAASGPNRSATSPATSAPEPRWRISTYTS